MPSSAESPRIPPTKQKAKYGRTLVSILKKTVNMNINKYLILDHKYNLINMVKKIKEIFNKKYKVNKKSIIIRISGRPPCYQMISNNNKCLLNLQGFDLLL